MTAKQYHCVRCGRDVDAFATILCGHCITDSSMRTTIPQIEELRRARDTVLDELRERNTELRAVWHAMACAFDHCERCIEDADVIKRVRFRLGPAT